MCDISVQILFVWCEGFFGCLVGWGVGSVVDWSRLWFARVEGCFCWGCWVWLGGGWMASDRGDDDDDTETNRKTDTKTVNELAGFGQHIICGLRERERGELNTFLTD